MNLFDPSNLIINENTDLLRLESYCDKEESFFFQTLSFISECRSDVDAANKVFYKSLLESGNNHIVINESFSDFFQSIKNVIRKVIEFVKSIFKRFLTKLNSLIKREKYLKNHKDDFNKFSSKNEFTFDGFTFTFLPTIPAVNTLTDYSKSIEDINVSGYAKGEDAKQTLKAKYETFIRDLDDHIYDEIRAQCIGSDSKYIYETEYAKELFCIFRDDQSTKEPIEVTASKVSEYYSRFTNFDKLEKEIKKDRDRIEKEYEKLKKQVDAAVKKTADGSSMTVDDVNGVAGNPFVADKDMVAILDLFVKAKANQIQNISNIHLLAFGAKLDAIKDCFNQDKTVLYRALSKIQGTLKEEV